MHLTEEQMIWYNEFETRLPEPKTVKVGRHTFTGYMVEDIMDLMKEFHNRVAELRKER